MKLSRKDFLKTSGALGAAIALTGCESPIQKLIPYVNQPQYPKPGEWIYYATTCRECPAGCGMLLWHRDGRVTKAEGVPENPINNGKLCARGQSSLQGLYDPERLREIKHSENHKIVSSDWNYALTIISAKQKETKGKIFIISDLQTGSLAELFSEITNNFNSPEPLYYEAYNYECLRYSYQKINGLSFIPSYNIQNSDFLLSFGADFLETWISPVQFGIQFSQFKKIEKQKKNSFCYVGPRFTMTATNADNYFQIPAGYEYSVAAELLRRIDASLFNKFFETIDVPDYKNYISEESITFLTDKIKNASSPLILAGHPFYTDFNSNYTALASVLLNQATGNKCIDYNIPHALSNVCSNHELENFLSQISRNDILIINNTDILFTKPGIKNRIKPGLSVYLGVEYNETAKYCDWVLPVDHYLESWGDYEPAKGITNFQQPVMKKLYNTLSSGDIFIKLSSFIGNPIKNGKEDISDYQSFLRSRWPDINWQEAISRGTTLKQTHSTIQPRLKDYNQNKNIPNHRLTLYATPSIYFFDGRTAERRWLQEAPDPVSTIAWGPWFDINPQNASELKILSNDNVYVETDAGNLTACVRITKDTAVNTISIYSGWKNPNIFSLFSHNPSSLTEIKRIYTVKGQAPIFLSIDTLEHDRDIVKYIKISEYNRSKNDDIITMPLPDGYNKKIDLNIAHRHKEHRWGMAIDLNSCTGCSACTIACYAENNIPVVGPEHCKKGREMAWLKVVPYRKEKEEYKVGHLPLPCQHCDSAPCETVCPVFASVHNEEGLNAQIYNRCIGTRYCSNNCPYKVRRFNWINIKWEVPLEMQLNPEVSVRDRGVMEKCTFCIQRIKNAEYHAELNDKKLKDGDVVPACAQTCPTNSILFGDLLDTDSEVYKIFTGNRRSYQLLHELNTKPAVCYLKKIEDE